MTTPPPDAKIWHSLHALADNDPRMRAEVDLDPEYPVICYRLSHDGRHPLDAWGVTQAELDELEQREWITLEPPGDDDEGGIAVTAKGKYWLNRWLKKQGITK